MANKFETLCTLSRKKAIEILENLNAETVMYKRGCWNTYSETDIKTAIEKVNKSPNGADVTRNTQTGVVYVCCPTDSDMW